ncbi:MAG: hypothetical protein LBT14_02225 [Treponema sp.]|jgi:Zn finger protein HypA/HybF involved in hydrogenase expression|nr:hypothetical protein [Treponema sp.]
MSDKNGVSYNPVIVEEDCEVYCRTCNKTVQLKKGDAIPLCCGQVMEIMD